MSGVAREAGEGGDSRSGKKKSGKMKVDNKKQRQKEERERERNEVRERKRKNEGMPVALLQRESERMVGRRSRGYILNQGNKKARKKAKTASS